MEIPASPFSAGTKHQVSLVVIRCQPAAALRRKMSRRLPFGRASVAGTSRVVTSGYVFTWQDTASAASSGATTAPATDTDGSVATGHSSRPGESRRNHTTLRNPAPPRRVLT